MKTLILVRVPMVCTYSEMEIEEFGIRTDYIKEHLHTDKNDTMLMRNDTNVPYLDMTTCMLPIERLLEIYSDGYPIEVINSNDVRKIFDILNKAYDEYNKFNKKDLNHFIIERFLDDIIANNTGELVRNAVDKSKEIFKEPEGIMKTEAKPKIYKNTNIDRIMYPTTTTEIDRIKKTKRPEYKGSNTLISNDLDIESMIDKALTKINKFNN